MTGESLTLCKAMGAGEDQEALLLPLIQAAQEMLLVRLKDNVTPSSCGAAFPLAVALVAMEGLEDASGLDRVSAITAGQISIKSEAGGHGRRTRQALRLLAPWLRDTGVSFQGVDG